MKGCFVGNGKKGRIQSREWFPSAEGSWASLFLLGAVVGGDSHTVGSVLAPGRWRAHQLKGCAAAYLCSSIHSHDMIHWASFLEFVFVLSLISPSVFPLPAQDVSQNKHLEQSCPSTPPWLSFPQWLLLKTGIQLKQWVGFAY